MYHNYSPQFAKGICARCGNQFKRQGPKQRFCRTCGTKRKRDHKGRLGLK